jgi:hypothetical protein
MRVKVVQQPTVLMVGLISPYALSGIRVRVLSCFWIVRDDELGIYDSLLLHGI